ncbi:MAG: anti-sigma factor antagonist [Solirubrobacterales bacterium]|jgi:anti-sigma B factor antagonist|nr:anti-sigma factor antagonist [Solirubrobacterales bacterium]
MSATPSADIPQFEINSGPGPDDVYVVRVAGEVDMSHEEELRGELRTAVAADAKGIVVDLSECEFIDSSGVRALLLSREAQHPEDGAERLAVAASSEQILRILSVMGIDRVIPIRPTVEEAAAAVTG